MMEPFGIKNPQADLRALGIRKVKQAHWNLSPEALMEAAIGCGQGRLADNGALVIRTGDFTGRAPLDRFIVRDELTAGAVDWGKINQPFDPRYFDRLYDRVAAYFADREVFVRDACAGADPNYRLDIRLISEYSWSNQFAYNMFLRPTAEELLDFEPDWTILCAPGFHADPAADGTRQRNFAILNFSRRVILIGGTGYTGEIKKGIFSVLNFLLPQRRGVLPMHCSANLGRDGDAAVFFGLSGTGKTTLSTDPGRALIGDDEHGWSDDGIFNFEGGCYAKTIDLTEESEPGIYRAIRHGAILENVPFVEGTRRPDYGSERVTQNTRVSYPLHHIENAVQAARASHPRHIFFLTADAFGVLPPLSRLTPGQAMYYFLSGYTAKVAGTEEGIDEPQATFSACFGAPFMPLHPTVYAGLLGEKIRQHDVKVWLVNTGWTGGAYGAGHRIRLPYTRAMISAVLQGRLDAVDYREHEIFGLHMPVECPGVPAALLDPRNTWQDTDAYDAKTNQLAEAFHRNFERFAAQADEATRQAAPRLPAMG